MTCRPLVALILLAGACATARAAEPATRPTTRPTLTDAETQAGWKLLFDGVSTAGWRGLGRDDFPAGRWVVQDGCLRCLGNAGSKAKADDLVPTQQFENFELSFEWMTPKKGGNSGVKYRVQEKKGEGFAFGPEYQCIDDGDKVDKGATGSLYDVLPPHDKKVNPAGQFNQSKIVVRGDHVEHWLNGVKVLEYEFGSDAFKAAVAQSKFKTSPTWGKTAKGYVALQDHNDEAWFRNIRIRELPAK